MEVLQRKHLSFENEKEDINQVEEGACANTDDVITKEIRAEIGQPQLMDEIQLVPCFIWPRAKMDFHTFFKWFKKS